MWDWKRELVRWEEKVGVKPAKCGAKGPYSNSGFKTGACQIANKVAVEGGNAPVASLADIKDWT